MLLSTFFIELLLSKTLYSKLFFMQIRDPVAIEKRASFAATTLLRKIWLPNEMGAWVGGVFNQQLWMKRSL